MTSAPSCGPCDGGTCSPNVYNLLVGNGDNHLKNLSFLVDAAGIRLAPAYDLLSTAVYDTPAFADDRARWPATALAWPLH